MLSIRKAKMDDLKLYFSWANDPEVRKHSYESTPIEINHHKKWFKSVLNNDLFHLYIFENKNGEKVGQVRIQKESNLEALIGISISSTHRGKGYAKEMLTLATDTFFMNNQDYLINAYIKKANLKSKFAFENAGFNLCNIISYKNYTIFHLLKTSKDENR